MSIVLPWAEFAKINDHGRRDYPNECCGVMLGKVVDGRRLVVEARALTNTRADSPRNRFMISPDEYLASEKYAREQKLEILGFYHSHPDHPARPSEYDRDAAWPDLSYVILSVMKGTPGNITSWELSEERVFLEEKLETARTLEELKNAR